MRIENIKKKLDHTHSHTNLTRKYIIRLVCLGKFLLSCDKTNKARFLCFHSLVALDMVFVVLKRKYQTNKQTEKKILETIKLAE